MKRFLQLLGGTLATVFLSVCAVVGALIVGLGIGLFICLGDIAIKFN